MRLSRFSAINYRNFAHVDIPLGEQVVVLGENRVGKSNLVHALRVLFDPTLSETARLLRAEDFWDGLGDTALSDGNAIILSVEFSDLEPQSQSLAALADFIVKDTPLTARITYSFRPKADASHPYKLADYEHILFGGEDESRMVGHELRRWLPMEFLHALRDAEGDLASWRRSPLRPLLDGLSISPEELTSVSKAIDTATSVLAQLKEIDFLSTRINENLVSLVGELNADTVALGFAASRTDRLMRAIRLFIDGSEERPLSDASLGALNVLYISLMDLNLRYQIERNERAHTILAIEEPEAHLHPHLQRLTYRHYLRERGESSKPSSRTLVLTTHSPHIASVTPLKSFVLLRRDPKTNCTSAFSTTKIALTETECADLERYLDVSRAEFLFAKGVILVEGLAEQLLLPSFASNIGVDLDRHGITVCAVGGTNFQPYVKLLLELQIPFAVITDLDRKFNSDPPQYWGKSRIDALRDLIAARYQTQSMDYNSNSIFTTQTTFEIELMFDIATRQALCAALSDLAPGLTARMRTNRWKSGLPEADYTTFLLDINAVGKGRLAQAFASRNKGNPPQYIHNAITFLKSRVTT